MSSTFSANRGSLLTLKVRVRWGLRPCAFQSFQTTKGLTSAASAMLDAGTPGGEKAVSPPSNGVEPNVQVAGRGTDPQAIRQRQKHPGPLH